jgi:4-amino-4-deoxy-L-arabinose transferase-like glycosyltransferase
MAGSFRSTLGPRRRLAIAAATFLAVAAILVLRVLSFSYPMHTDARTYAYIAERLLEGQVLYRDVWEYKPPGFYYLYALVFAIGGHTGEALIVARHLLEAAGLGLLALLLRRLYGWPIAILGTVLTGLFSSSVALQRSTLMAEHPMLVAVLLALLALASAVGPRREWWTWLAAGLAGGLAATFKQLALVILAGPVVTALFTSWRHDPGRSVVRVVERALLFGLGMILPTAAWVAYFWREHALGSLQDVARVSAAFASATGDVLLPNALRAATFMAEEVLLWLLATAWLGWLVWADRDDSDLLVGAWLLASVASLLVVGVTFPHYFIPVVPALAAAAAIIGVRLMREVAALSTRAPSAFMVLGLVFGGLLALFMVKQVRVYGLVVTAQQAEVTRMRLCTAVGRLLGPTETVYEWTGGVECWRFRNPTRFAYYWAFRFIGPDRLNRALGRSWLGEVTRDLEAAPPRVVLISNERQLYLDDIRPFPALVELLRREYRLAERFTFEHDGHEVDVYVRVTR